MKTTIKTQASILAFAAAFAAFGGTQAASAAAIDDVPSKTVAYADLNLESRSGAQALYARLRVAARQVCSSLDDKNLGHRNAWQACLNDAVNSAVMKVNKAMVTLIHSEAAGRAEQG